MNAVSSFLVANEIELAAFVLGVANVALLVRRSLWNYPFGLAMVSLYAVVFFEAKLYSDALLQVFFFAVNLWGWWLWRRAGRREGDIRVMAMTTRSRLGWLAGMAVATLLWGFAMHRWTDAAFPFWDATVAIPSVAAQILLSRRRFENWILWIAVDIVAIGLYAAKGLWLTTVLYVIFLVLSTWGLVQWQRARRVTGPAVA